jgi:hypothetical protein
LTGNEPPTSCPSLGLLAADLKVLIHQIQLSLGADPTMLEHCQMLYMLANVHYQIATGEVLPPPDCFLYYLSDLLYEL